MLTIVTASHDNAGGLEALGHAIRPVLGDDLRWVVKDSGVCNASRSWAETMRSPYFCFDPAPDTGIYDALNRALTRVGSTFYLVVGSDDRVDGETLVSVVSMLRADPDAGAADVLTFPVRTPEGLRRRKRFRPLWVSSSSLTSSHSVGTLIRTSLHAKVGLYDTRYRILADSLFLRLAWRQGARFLHRDRPTLGDFALEGVSSRQHATRLRETYSYQVEAGSSPVLQALLLFLRLCVYRPRVLL